MKNQKNVAENLKLKLNRFNDLCAKLYCSIVLFISSLQVAFAEEADNYDFSDSALDISDTSNAVNSTEQSMAAEQVGENAMNSGNNVLNSIKTFFESCTNKLHDIGGFASSHLEKITGGNPFVTKLIVCLILVLISIFIIVVLVLIAKLLIFKKKRTNIFEKKTNIKTSKVQEDIDNNDDLEDDDFEDDEEYEEPQIPNQKQVAASNNIQENNNDSSDMPKNINDAVIKFLQITE